MCVYIYVCIYVYICIWLTPFNSPFSSSFFSGLQARTVAARPPWPRRPIYVYVYIYICIYTHIYINGALRRQLYSIQFTLSRL